MDPSRLAFQHNNGSKHMSKSVQEWLTSQPFQLLLWLAQFSDLNPIEQLWAFLKQCLNEFTTPPKDIQELWEYVCSVYPNFNKHDCMAFNKRMPRRIDVVLKSRDY